MRILLRRFVGFSYDLLVSACALFAAYLTAFGYPEVFNVPAMENKLLGFVACSAVAFYVFSTNRGSWRYVSTPDLVSIIKAAMLASLVYTVAAFILERGQDLPRSVPILTPIYMMLAMAGARVCYRMMHESSLWPSAVVAGGRPGVRPVLLYGFSDKAESFIRSTRRDAGSVFSVLGIIDDAQVNFGRTVQGVKVLGGLDALDDIVARLNRQGLKAEELVVTQTSPAKQQLASVLERANALSIKVSRIPDPTEMEAVTSNLLMVPKPIELADLLERPEVRADLEGVARLIEGKVVVVTGAGGSIGSELCRQIAGFRPSRLVITDSAEFHLYTLDFELRRSHPDLDIMTRIMDVRDAVRVSNLLSSVRPQLVFHTAALKHVPMMEENPLEAVKTNVLGTRNVADAAVAAGTTTFVLISSDKAVNPTNIMGATKRAAEAYCQALDVVSEHTRFKTVRFGNVLGSNGSVVPRFQQQIAAGGPVTVTHPHIMRYFMTIPEAVRLVLHASAQALARSAERGKIMVLDMGKPVRILDLAERMIQLAGYRPRVDIDIVFSGLRPGDKLYEELFDPSEVLGGRTEEGYVVAAPRIIDRRLVERTLTEMGSCAQREDVPRTLELLAHIVPEYRNADAQPASPPAKPTPADPEAGSVARIRAVSNPPESDETA